MPDSKDGRYTIEDRQLIAETADLRVQILTLANDQQVPWHYHSEVTDTFTCLEGPMVVKTKTADADHELLPGDTVLPPYNWSTWFEIFNDDVEVLGWQGSDIPTRMY
jgi:quercetin dioxygenase-like cupin family protein